MAIENLEYNFGDERYFDPSFRNELEAHVKWLREHATTGPKANSEFGRYKFEFDMFGLFRHLGIPEKLHWLTMRMNKFTNPYQSTAHIDIFLVPDEGEFDRIFDHWNSMVNVPTSNKK